MPLAQGKEDHDHVVGDGLLLDYGLINLYQNKGASSTCIGLTFALGTFVDLSLSSRIK